MRDHNLCLQAYSRTLREVLPIISKCLDSMDTAAASVNPVS